MDCQEAAPFAKVNRYPVKQSLTVLGSSQKTADRLVAAETWKKPLMGWMSCCVDAAVFTSSGACGMVRRDDKGHFLGASVVHFPYFRDPAVLEVMAIREALSWIKERRLQKVIIESDNLNAVQAINESMFFNSNYGLLVLDCRDILTTLLNVRVVFIRRSANYAVYTLVRTVGSHPGHHVWGFSAPSCITVILANDLMQ